MVLYEVQMMAEKTSYANLSALGVMILLSVLTSGRIGSEFHMPQLVQPIDLSCNQSGESFYYSDCHTERAIVNDRFIGSDGTTYVVLTNEKFIEAYVKTYDPTAIHSIKINSTCDFRLGTYSGRYQTILSMVNCSGGLS